jgi:hypothetical protein
MDDIYNRTRTIFSIFRSAFTREDSFSWFCATILSMLMRNDLAGVTSLARSMGAGHYAWKALLSFFASSAVNLERLTSLWVDFILSHGACVKINERRVLVVDGIKVAKSGRKMPGNKRLHQSSQSNTKPEYITGHSCQSIAVLLSGAAGVFAVPVFTRIFEGLRWPGVTPGSQVQRLARIIKAMLCNEGCYIIADAYYMADTFIREVLESGAHVITRARSNAVAYLLPDRPLKKKRGRPSMYGSKLYLRDLASEECGYIEAISPVYGEAGVVIQYKAFVMMAKSLGRAVKYVVVKHPVRGTIFLVTTDLDMEPLDVVKAYGLRFKIEVSFKSAVRSVGTFAYHFWSEIFSRDSAMKGDVDMSKYTPKEQIAVHNKIKSYHLHIMVGHIAQGIAQVLAVEMPEVISKLDSEYRRTICEMPSEATVMQVFRKNVRIFDGIGDKTKTIKKAMRNFMAESGVNQLFQRKKTA